MEKFSFPMRINKYLAHRGISTRRSADALIQRGVVFINGRRAVLGDIVHQDDTIEVTGKEPKSFSYFAYHKPRGILTLESPPPKTVPGRKRGPAPKSIKDAGIPKSVFPIGRLDKDSSGLLILTDDGRITERVLNPEQDHEKEYHVSVDKTVTDRFLRLMAAGIDIEGYRTKPAQTKRLGEDNFTITLTEGKKHQIRRMCAALGYQVRTLKRIRIMNVHLGKLKPGEFRPLEEKELGILLRSLGL